MSRRRYIFEVVKGRQRGRRFDVVDDEVRVGRILASHQGWLRFSDRSVSRDQAVFRWDEALDRYVLTNSSDTNPTRVNGESVREKVLEDGDEICMGNVVLRVVSLDMPTPHVNAAPRAPLRRAGSSEAAPERAASGGPSQARGTPTNRPPAPETGSGAGKRLPRADLARLLGEIGLMLRAGVTIPRVLDGLSQRASTPAVRGLCQQLLAQVVRGHTLSAAMREQNRVFSPLHVETVAAGEKCGKLDTVLADLGAWEERDLSLTRAVASALTYPMTVLACGVLVVVVLGNRVLAALLPVFAQTGKPLPLLTQVVFGISALMQHPAGVLAASLGVVTLLWGAVQWRHTPRGRRVCDEMVLRLPVTGRLTRMLFVARFCSHLKLLYGGGIPLLSALSTSLAASGNTCLRERVAEVTARLREGERLADALTRCGEFPPLALGMIEVGEETRRLVDVLGRLAEIYDQEVYFTLEQAVKLLEPVVIVGMGLMVAVIVLATLLPLYQLVNV